MFYSKSTNGFYDPAIHGDNIPADAVEISVAEHAALMAAQGAGKSIKADAEGRPVASDPPPLSLDQLKADKRNDVKAACSAAIQAGIVCNALGTNHTYPTAPTDQQNLAATVLAAQVNGAAGELYKFWCADSGGAWARRPHTAAQILAVGEAVRAHVVAQQEHYEQKLIEIDQATAETISTITW